MTGAWNIGPPPGNTPGAGNSPGPYCKPDAWGYNAQLQQVELYWKNLGSSYIPPIVAPNFPPILTAPNNQSPPNWPNVGAFCQLQVRKWKGMQVLQGRWGAEVIDPTLGGTATWKFAIRINRVCRQPLVPAAKVPTVSPLAWTPWCPGTSFPAPNPVTTPGATTQPPTALALAGVWQFVESKKLGDNFGRERGKSAEPSDLTIPVDPCGRAVDAITRLYDADVHFGTDPTQRSRIRWVWCRDGAEDLGVVSTFTSRSWCQHTTWPSVGEIYYTTDYHVSQTRMSSRPGTARPCGDPAVWLVGYQGTIPPRFPRNMFGVALCCGGLVGPWGRPAIGLLPQAIFIAPWIPKLLDAFLEIRRRLKGRLGGVLNCPALWAGPPMAVPVAIPRVTVYPSIKAPANDALLFGPLARKAMPMIIVKT